MLELIPSFISGLCAAGAGSLGKFAFAPLEGDSDWNAVVLRGIGFVLMLVLNAVMLSYFVKSIAVLGSSRATLANFTCNYLTSVRVTQAFFGWAIYGEALSLQWGLGASLMLVGIYFVLHAK
jgi:drug/metabolite transporter (DMT)-like permease